MPYLEEWSALEEGYLTCLSEAIQSLLNASFQLPVGANVMVRGLSSSRYITDLQCPHQVRRKPKMLIFLKERMMDSVTLSSG